MLIAGLLIAGFGFKKPAKAYYYDDGGSTGRGALFGGLTGAAFGGAIGGGRGAAIGGAVGLGVGALAGSSRSRGRDPYRQLGRLEKKRDRALSQADKSRIRAQQARSDRSRSRFERRARSAEMKAQGYDRDIMRMKRNLGMK